MDEDSSITAPLATLPEHKSPAAITPSPTAPTDRPPAAWASIETDVSLDGKPAQEWLVISPAGLAVAPVAVSRGDPVPAAAMRPVVWSDIERVRTTAGVGGGMLQVRLEGDWVDLVRYSNALATRFHKVARAAEAARDAAAAEGIAIAEPRDRKSVV